MKYFFLKILPLFIKNLFKRNITDRPIYNYFKSDHSKRVLISYILNPFKKQSKSHTNFFEAITAAEIFNDLGYQVDIVHYEQVCKVLEGYDLIYGFGETLEYFYAKKFNPKTKVINYSTGMHQFLQNVKTMQRVKDVYAKKGIWLINSARLTDKSWFRQIVLSDAVIALGNEAVRESFEPYYKKNIYLLNSPFYLVKNYSRILDNKEPDAHNHFIWFGSSGMVHKGLDLCLEFFSQNKRLTLHVCGPVAADKQFIKAFRKELFETSNIILHGFVDIESEKFERLLETSYFAIFPSCSEGGSPSLLTLIGNGGLVALLTPHCSITVPHALTINGFSFNEVEHAVKASQKIDIDQLKDFARENAEYVRVENSQERYRHELRKIIEQVIVLEE